MSDPLSITASLIAVLQLSNAVIKYLKDVKDGSSDRIRLRDELRNATCLIQMLQDRLEDAADSGAPSLQPATMAMLSDADGPLVLFEKTLNLILQRLAPQNSLGKRIRCISWPFHKQQVAELLNTLERLKTYLSLMLQNDLSAAVGNISLKLDDVAQQVERLDPILRETQEAGADLKVSRLAEEKEKVLSWISTSNHTSKQAEVLDSVQVGTGQWFLQDPSFTAWCKGEFKTLWCYGIPGAGKTKLISLAIQHLEDQYTKPQHTLAYIYCDYNQRASQTPLDLLSTLLLQILRRSEDPNLPPEVTALYSLHQKYKSRQTAAQITEVLRKICAAYEMVHFVVDALDECSDSDELTLELVATIHALGPNISLLCTSRTSTPFDRYFEGHRRLQISARAEDIRTVLTARLPSYTRLFKHIQADNSLEEEIVSTIIDGSQGMFLIATLHLESLARKITRRDVRNSLKTLPTTLDATYAQVMARIQSQGEEDANLAEQILFWIVCSRRALTVQDLRHMLAVRTIEGETLDAEDLPAEDILTEVCKGLVIVDEDHVSVRLIHYSAQQYLQRVYPDRLSTARLELTKLSIAYLMLPNLLVDGVCHTDKAMASRLERYPFISYAGRFWGAELHNLDIFETWRELDVFLESPNAISIANQVMCMGPRHSPNWSQNYPRNVPALVLASSFSAPDLLQLLLSRGQNTESTGSDHETPLIRAATRGLTSNVKILLKLDARVHAAELSGETALHRAAAHGDKALVELLIQYGAEIDATAAADWVPLMSAVLGGNLDIVQVLVAAGADISRRTSWGDSALSLATRSGAEAIANYLADAGAILPNSRAGRRASVVASRKGLQALVRRLTMDYDAVASMGLQRQRQAGRSQLASLAETVEGSVARINSPAHQSSPPTEEGVGDFSHFVEGREYTKGFNRRYELSSQLGRGHSATAYLCTSKITGISYAVKVFSDVSKAKSIREEIDILGSMRHENIIKLIDLVVEDRMEKIYLVLELAAEGELFNFIVAKQKLTEAESRTVSRQLCSALLYLVSINSVPQHKFSFVSYRDDKAILLTQNALRNPWPTQANMLQHNQGWIHRDVKPENILLADSDFTIKLIDFDISSNIQNEDGSHEMATTLCGTPSYVAPEVLEQLSRRTYSIPVDIWSAGVVLYICLCGFPPFSDELCTTDYPYTLSEQIKTGRFDYPSPYWDSVGDPALDLIDRMLSVDIGARLTAEPCLQHPGMANLTDLEATNLSDPEV